MHTVTPIPINFQIDTSEIEDTGMSITPDDLSEVLYNQTIDLTFECDTSGTRVTSDEIVNYHCLIIFTEHIAYRIDFTTSLKYPKFDISRVQIDFEHTIIGWKRMSTFQIQDNSPATQKYNTLNKVQHVQNAKEVRKVPIAFSCLLICCCLPPNSFQNIDVTFEPSSDKMYSAEFQVSIARTPVVTTAKCSGQGVTLRLEFDHDTIDYGTLLPYSVMLKEMSEFTIIVI